MKQAISANSEAMPEWVEVPILAKEYIRKAREAGDLIGKWNGEFVGCEGFFRNRSLMRLQHPLSSVDGTTRNVPAEYAAILEKHPGFADEVSLQASNIEYHAIQGMRAACDLMDFLFGAGETRGYRKLPVNWSRRVPAGMQFFPDPESLTAVQVDRAARSVLRLYQSSGYQPKFCAAALSISAESDGYARGRGKLRYRVTFSLGDQRIVNRMRQILQTKERRERQRRPAPAALAA